MPNVLRPMAYLDVQVLAAEALARAADLGVGDPARLRAASLTVRDATIAHFWVPERQYFGHAIDRGPDGRPRLLRAVQSNAGWMLATGFFDDLPEASRRRLVGGIVRMLFSAELLTPAGVRGRALSEHNPRFRNYHENVWPVDTAAIARGLRRQGFDELAGELEARLLNVANMLGGAFEFVAVDERGRIFDPRLTAAARRGPVRPAGGRPAQRDGARRTHGLDGDRAARHQARTGGAGAGGAGGRGATRRPPRLAARADARGAGLDRARRGLRHAGRARGAPCRRSRRATSTTPPACAARPPPSSSRASAASFPASSRGGCGRGSPGAARVAAMCAAAPAAAGGRRLGARDRMAASGGGAGAPPPRAAREPEEACRPPAGRLASLSRDRHERIADGPVRFVPGARRLDLSPAARARLPEGHRGQRVGARARPLAVRHHPVELRLRRDAGRRHLRARLRPAPSERHAQGRRSSPACTPPSTRSAPTSTSSSTRTSRTRARWP